MLALSLSISTRGSPFLTCSPSCFSHLTIFPVSIESERRGIWTSGMAASVPAEQCFGRDHDVRLAGKGDLLQDLAVGSRNLRASQAGDRSIQVIERILVQAGSDFGSDAELAPAL